MKYVLSAGVAAAALAAGAHLAHSDDSRAKANRNATPQTQVAQAPQGPLPSSSRPWLPASPWYVSIAGAAAFPNNTNFTVGPFAGNIDYDTGFHGFVGLGYRVTPWISAELEVGYLYLPVDRISAGAASASVDGNLRGLAAFGNAVLTYPNLPYMTPYIAGGAGMVHRFETDVTVAGVSGTLDSGTDFAAQAKAGIDFRLTQSMSIAPEYRYMFINTSGDGLSNTHIHSIGASFKIRF
ncbi:MAG: porin family protein [Alphaproteobacteria bacterium]